MLMQTVGTLRKSFALATLTTLTMGVASSGAGCRTFYWEPEAEVDGGFPGQDATVDPNNGSSEGGVNGGEDAQPRVYGGPTLPNCVGLTTLCNGESCCTSNLVPGGTFNRSSDPAFPATLTDYRLDKYEVSMGRFRAFVNAGQGTQANPPAVGSGAHPKNPGSGWLASYNSGLLETTGLLRGTLFCRGGQPEFPLWTDAPGLYEA